MTEQEAIQIVYEGLSGKESIPVKLRMGQGLDKMQLKQVKEALHTLMDLWRDQIMVPKRVALAFVDLQGAMQWGGNRYSTSEQDEIEDAAIALLQLAYELFEVPEQ
jgi:hypothetical protein